MTPDPTKRYDHKPRHGSDFFNSVLVLGYELRPSITRRLFETVRASALRLA